MGENLVEPLAWSLLHSLWQHGLIAAMLWQSRRRTAHWSASSRYALSGAMLALAALAPAATFLLLLAAPDAAATPHEGSLAPIAAAAGAVSSAVASAAPTAEWVPPAPSLMARVARPLVAVWLAGVVLFGIRFLGGWVCLQRLRWVGVVPPAAEWRRSVEDLAARMGVYRPVWLYESRQVVVPTLIGWLRPVILLPVGMLTGLSPAQVEAMLAHELAHVRRHDYLVNLVQSLVDVFYYYSPGAWYLSRAIREEREYCCDDLAVEATGNPMALGRALAELEKGRRRSLLPEAALAATGGDLLARIRRIVLPGSATSQSPSRPALAPVAGLAVVALTLLSIGPVPAGAGTESDQSEQVTAATHRAFLDGRRLITLKAHDITLAQACTMIGEASGLQFDLPADAAAQRVSVDFADVSATMVANAIFNLLEMDHPVDPATGHFLPAYWEGSGTRDEVVRLSLAYYHARQTMFHGLKHELNWTSSDEVALGEGTRRLSEMTGIEFAFRTPDLAAIRVHPYMPSGTARDALHLMLKPAGLNYRYLDDSRILIEP